MYKNLREAVQDLERHGMLLRIKHEVDPNLEMAEIHRQIFAVGGPAILFERVKGSPFQAVSNIYGTIERTAFLFRHTLPKAQKIIELKRDPSSALRNPLRYASAPLTALTALPRKRWFSAPITYGKCRIDQLPQIKSWPMDGGAFVTLPQVYTEDPDAIGQPMHSNIGMYRIQLSGNQYIPNKEIGMHYQLHRGIGVHHTKYNTSDKPFRATVMVGGPPSYAFAAIMPLPEGLSELTFAGLLGGNRFGYVYRDGHFLGAETDFCITGIIEKGIKKPEGPFGDHLGYYSLTHDFPVMRVEQVWHRKDPLWHFSVVGRPPAEDSSFGWLIHQLVKPLTSQEFPGLRNIHAVDAAGVHPLLLAVGSERYMPFRERKPEEILTIANRIIGSGQTSLAKFLIIAADEPHLNLDSHDIPAFFRYVLERIDLRRDLHFHTRTTIDTLDYSGTGWNEGSKVVMAACGDPLRTLGTETPSALRLPQGCTDAHVALPGVLAITAPKYSTVQNAQEEIQHLCHTLEGQELKGFPMIVVCDDASFVAATLNNFLWVTFTRANPSHDLYGVGAFTEFKHWGCTGPLIIDARVKPHHAPVLQTDPGVEKKVRLMLQEMRVV